MDELKACPFCGKEATTSEKAGIAALPFGVGWVGCQKCHVFMDYTHGERGKKEAIAAWNRRTQPENKQYDPKFCTGCRSVDNDADNYPCNECRRAYTDKFEPEQQEQKLCSENENFIQNKFGYCFYTLDSSPLIYNLYVHPQYRRHGNSRALLELVIREIRKSGYDGEIRIQAEPREDSIGLADLIKYYQSMGLAIYETHKPKQEGK